MGEWRAKGMQRVGNEGSLSAQERLFLSVAEQLSRPLLTLSRLSELAVDDPPVAAAQWPVAHAIAESSLHLVENYSLGLRVHGKVTPLALEPIAISALLYDTAEQLKPFAQQYGVELELDAGPRTLPVLADRAVLQAAFESLGQVFVAAQAEAETPGPVRLMAHRGRYGVVAGLYGDTPQLGVDSLRRAQVVQGRARQPLQQLVSGPAAGVFVADNLLRTLESRLHVARYHNLNGLAATLQSSHQLQFV